MKTSFNTASDFVVLIIKKIVTELSLSAEAHTKIIEKATEYCERAMKSKLNDKIFSLQYICQIYSACYCHCSIASQCYSIKLCYNQ